MNNLGSGRVLIDLSIGKAKTCARLLLIHASLRNSIFINECRDRIHIHR